MPKQRLSIRFPKEAVEEDYEYLQSVFFMFIVLKRFDNLIVLLRDYCIYCKTKHLP